MGDKTLENMEPGQKLAWKNGTIKYADVTVVSEIQKGSVTCRVDEVHHSLPESMEGQEVDVFADKLYPMEGESDNALEADNPDVAEAAHRLRRLIANWRDRLKGRQDGDFDESRQRLIDQLGEDYRRVNDIALRSEG